MFDSRRAQTDRVVFNAWVRRGIGIKATHADNVAAEALKHGTINQSYLNMNESRVWRTPMNEHYLYSGPGVVVPAPAAYHATAVPTLHATVRHDGPTLAVSTRMLLTVDVGYGPIAPSAILGDPNFVNRSMDVLWYVWKVEAAA